MTSHSMISTAASDMISTASPDDVMMEFQWAATLKKQQKDEPPQEEEGYASEGTEVTSNTGPSTKSSVEKKARTGICDADGCSNALTKCCSRCHKVYYCGAACQRAHWKFHKPSCVTTDTSPTRSRRSSAAPLPKRLPPRSRPRRLPARERRGPSNHVVKMFSSPATALVVRRERETTDEQSVRSKPSVIKVANDVEEDFERFQEVDDDDKLSNSNRRQYYGPNSTASQSLSSFAPLTEERVRAHLRDYYEDFDSIFRLGKSSKAAWDSFFSQYFTADIQWVRSSSNSLTGPELAEHFANDIVGIRMKLVQINSIQILAGTSAVVTFTADQKFEYRGTPNSDRTKITMVLVCTGREIRIAHEHRCTGKPIPQDANWD